MAALELRRGDDIRLNWEAHNELVTLVREQARQIALLRADLEKWRHMGGGAGGGMNFAGEWSDAETYAVNDVVFVSDPGPTMGAYICTTDGADGTTPPWEGAGWAKFPTGMGPWV